ncbi:MAG TPA: MoaD/ThiS family protein [Chthoniobacterales bacterium]|nr:MoaD/ThiS family protein [Chthoniobacterales bacterium]
MLVQIQYFSRLGDFHGPEKAEVSEQASIEELLNQLYSSVPGLKTWDKYLLIAVGTEYVSRDHRLAPNDLVSLMPPVQGG